MPLIAQQPTFAAAAMILVLLGIILLGSIYVWGLLSNRYMAGKPVLPPYCPRRFAPWSGFDLLIILSFYFLVLFSFSFGTFLLEKWTAQNIASQKNQQPTAEAKVGKTTDHPIAQLLKDKDPLVLVLAWTVGAVIAPIVEEFLFRVLLIGWLESVERRWLRRSIRLLRILPCGLVPIVFSSVLFAALHYRRESPTSEESHLIFTLCLTGAVSLLTLAFSLSWLHWHNGATAKDFGWDRAYFLEDLRWGATAFFAIAVPIFALQSILKVWAIPEKYAPDPIALFFFAIVLALLYYRTHRIVPSIVLHMMLNSTSLTIAWLAQ
jgi:membrane protease YdiL (CAAX protease family)